VKDELLHDFTYRIPVTPTPAPKSDPREAQWLIRLYVTVVLFDESLRRWRFINAWRAYRMLLSLRKEAQEWDVQR
jgi:hypothetical protein